MIISVVVAAAAVDRDNLDTPWVAADHRVVVGRMEVLAVHPAHMDTVVAYKVGVEHNNLLVERTYPVEAYKMAAVGKGH